MSLVRFFSMILVFGFWHVSGIIFAGTGQQDGKGTTINLQYTAPDTPDMPSDDPNEPDGGSLMFTAPDTPDMPSDDPSEPDGGTLMFTAPDTPDMPSDDPSEPDGRTRGTFSTQFNTVAPAQSLWDRALGWLQSLIDL